MSISRRRSFSSWKRANPALAAISSALNRSTSAANTAFASLGEGAPSPAPDAPLIALAPCPFSPVGRAPARRAPSRERLEPEPAPEGSVEPSGHRPGLEADISERDDTGAAARSPTTGHQAATVISLDAEPQNLDVNVQNPGRARHPHLLVEDRKEARKLLVGPIHVDSDELNENLSGTPAA